MIWLKGAGNLILKNKKPGGAFLLEKMINQFYGYKKDQIQVFNKKNLRLAITIIKAWPLEIKRLKTLKKDGYFALQVGIIKNEKKKKPLVREIKLSQELKMKIKEKIKLSDVFKVNDKVMVSGKTKGKGFSGVIKRWGFHGGPKTHGQSDRQRAPGSIGQRTDPGRVWKGKKMAGHMGCKTKTIKGLKVYKVREEKNELWITGLIPGGKGGLLKITK